MLVQSCEEGMATRSSILAWRIPWTEEHIVHTVTELATSEGAWHAQAVYKTQYMLCIMLLFGRSVMSDSSVTSWIISTIES